MPSHVQSAHFISPEAFNSMKNRAREALAPLIKNELANLDLFYDKPDDGSYPDKKFNVLTGRWFTPGNETNYRKKNILLKNRDCTYESLDPREWLFLADACTWVPKAWVKNKDGCLHGHVAAISGTTQYYARKTYTHRENDHILKSSISNINDGLQSHFFQILPLPASDAIKQFLGPAYDHRPDLVSLLQNTVILGNNRRWVEGFEGYSFPVCRHILDEYDEESFYYGEITNTWYLYKDSRDEAEEEAGRGDPIDLEAELMDYSFDPVEAHGFMKSITPDNKVTLISGPKDDKTMYFGLELEFELDADPDEFTADDLDSVTAPFKKFKLTPCYDGSLDFGIEFKSVPMEYRDALACIDAIPKSAWGNFKTQTRTCGLHIHVSRNVLSPIQLGLMIKFMNDYKNEDFLEKIGGRDLNNYCQQNLEFSKLGVMANLTKSKKPDPHYKEKYFHEGREHYDILNFSNVNTVEFRFFKGKPDPDHIKSSIEFVQCITELCGILGRTRPNIIATGITQADILQHVKLKKRFPHLFKTCVHRELLPPPRQAPTITNVTTTKGAA